MRKLIKQIGLAIATLSIVFFTNLDAKAASTDFTYTVDDTTHEATITSYKGSATELTIPDSIDGYKVTKLGVDSFNGNKTLQTVIIPGTVKSIEQFAFYNATNLKEVTIENGCKEILCNAFRVCFNLEKIVIPASVTTFEYKDSGNWIFGALNNLNAYIEPGSAAQTYFDTYEKDINYYYLDEYSPSSITFTNPTITINVGDTYTFKNSDFNVLPNSAYITKPSSYTTSDSNIAYFKNLDVTDHTIIARKVGTVTVNATISDEHLKNSVSTTKSITVNVVENRKAVESVSLNTDNLVELYVGDTLQLNATVSPSDATYSGQWEILASRGIVSVSDTGLVTALAEGAQQVYYSTLSNFGNVYESNGACVLVQVSAKPITPTEPTTPSNPVTPSIPIEPTTPSNPTPSDPTIPVTPSNPGTGTTDNSGSTKNPTNTEVKAQGKITLNATKIDLQKGKTIKTLALASNELSGDTIVNVSSSNTKVLKASLKGQTIVLKGSKVNKKYVTVTVTMNSGAQATCKVKVVSNEVKMKKLTTSDKKLTLSKGNRYTLSVVRNPISATAKLTYKSSNTKVATVDKNGKIKAKKKGKTTITVTSANGKKTTCKVTVK